MKIFGIGTDIVELVEYKNRLKDYFMKILKNKRLENVEVKKFFKLLC